VRGAVGAPMKEVVDIDPVGMALSVEVPDPQNCPIP
jgi:hypothetical protein